MGIIDFSQHDLCFRSWSCYLCQTHLFNFKLRVQLHDGAANWWSSSSRVGLVEPEPCQTRPYSSERKPSNLVVNRAHPTSIRGRRHALNTIHHTHIYTYSKTNGSPRLPIANGSPGQPAPTRVSCRPPTRACVPRPPSRAPSTATLPACRGPLPPPPAPQT
jgi:hypothetical protein